MLMCDTVYSTCNGKCSILWIVRRRDYLWQWYPVSSSPYLLLLLLLFLPIRVLLSHPFQDFLFPRSLQPNYRSRRTLPHPSPPTDTGRPLFPPVRHLSFHSPVTTCPDNYLNTVDTGKPNHMPPVNPATVQALPSADGLQKLQLTEPPAGSGIKPHAAFRSPAR